MEPEPAGPVHRPRRRLWIAVAVTAAAVPLLVLDNRSDDDEPTSTIPTMGMTSGAPLVDNDRPETGPPKGVSVVTSSTTSSTTPITTTITTLAP